MPSSTVPGAPDSTDLRVGPPQLLAPILSRALTSLAARHDVTVDRISDAMLLSDAISAGAPRAFEDGHVSLSIADREEGVELRVGPMKGGAAERLRASLHLPELGGSLETLADEVRVEQGVTVSLPMTVGPIDLTDLASSQGFIIQGDDPTDRAGWSPATTRGR